MSSAMLANQNKINTGKHVIISGIRNAIWTVGGHSELFEYRLCVAGIERLVWCLTYPSSQDVSMLLTLSCMCVHMCVHMYVYMCDNDKNVFIMICNHYKIVE